MTNPTLMLYPIFVPVIAGALALLASAGRRFTRVAEALLILGTAGNLAAAAVLFPHRFSVSYQWADFGLDMAFRNDGLSAFMLISAAALSFVIAIYTARFLRQTRIAGLFAALFLFTIALVDGAVLANNLVALLFFWEGMLVTLFAMIAIGHAGAFKTAVKAFFIGGVTDLCLMAGIGLTIYLAGTATISAIHLGTSGLAGLAFMLLLIGAISKAGAMPFHSWIPDAAVDAPMPFMALMPAVIEKLIGIYLVARITLGMFKLEAHGWPSMVLMIVGAATIILAVLMALVQQDYKRLLSFHAISQVGYMLLGIGTAVPVGIVGGLFHTINHTLYKSALFLTSGAVEKQAGTTDLKKLGGLAAKMPVTFWVFVIGALSISGFPLTNGFYSKELIYDGALERGMVFYAIAVLGSFFTAASFLKLGHAAFKGKLPEAHAQVKEAPLSMLVPMGTIAAACLVFGLFNYLPLQRLVEPAVGAAALAGHHSFAGLVPHSWGLVAMTCLALALAFANHVYGVKRTGLGLGAVDHIHYAPVMHQLYDRAERRQFDPYELFLKLVNLVAWLGYWIDRGIDFIYSRIATAAARLVSRTVGQAHAGNQADYLTWSFLGAVLVFIYLLGGY